MTDKEIEGRIREFLAGHLGMSDRPIATDERLFSSSLLDSTDILFVVSFLETAFGITVSPLDVSLDHFDTIGAMAKFVIARRR
jgi:acyl carrier protein